MMDIRYEKDADTSVVQGRRVAVVGYGSQGPAHANNLREQIRNGEFAREFILENRGGTPVMKAMRRRAAEHPVEEVGARLRAMMPWIRENRLVDESRN